MARSHEEARRDAAKEDERRAQEALERQRELEKSTPKEDETL